MLIFPEKDKGLRGGVLGGESKAQLRKALNVLRSAPLALGQPADHPPRAILHKVPFSRTTPSCSSPKIHTARGSSGGKWGSTERLYSLEAKSSTKRLSRATSSASFRPQKA